MLIPGVTYNEERGGDSGTWWETCQMWFNTEVKIYCLYLWVVVIMMWLFCGNQSIETPHKSSVWMDFKFWWYKNWSPIESHWNIYLLHVVWKYSFSLILRSFVGIRHWIHALQVVFWSVRSRDVSRVGGGMCKCQPIILRYDWLFVHWEAGP